MRATLDRKVFFAKVRQSIFGGRLSQSQVDNMSVLLDEAERRGITDLRFTAYVLATTRGEVGSKMAPVREGGRGKGKPYGKIDPKTGKVYYGRGYVQLTWAENYRKMGKILRLPLYQNPDLALKPEIAAKIIWEGMTRGDSFKGDFTKYSLEDFFTSSKTDWLGARKIVNPKDYKTYKPIAAWARKFHDALVAASTPLKTPDRLVKSRTIGGSLVAGGGGIGAVIGQLKDAHNYLPTNWLAIVIGVVIIASVVYVIYARWDDAGRPSLSQILSGVKVSRQYDVEDYDDEIDYDLDDETEWDEDKE